MTANQMSSSRLFLFLNANTLVEVCFVSTSVISVPSEELNVRDFTMSAILIRLKGSRPSVKRFQFGVTLSGQSDVPGHMFEEKNALHSFCRHVTYCLLLSRQCHFH